MKRKSLFKASFEESLNLLDDGFLQYQLKEQDKKMSKPPRNVFDYFKNAVLYGILNLFSQLASISCYWLFQQCFILVTQKI